MINLENATIAIPSKGRLTEDALEWLNESTGSDFPVAREPFDRTRELYDSSSGITLLGLSNGDVFSAVNEQVLPGLGIIKLADVGILGTDKIREMSLRERRIPGPREPLGFGSCKLVVARPADTDPATPIKRVVTPYPAIARWEFAGRCSEPDTAEIDAYSGSIEMIARRAGYDALLDVMETGDSLAANGFVPVKVVMESQAELLSSIPRGRPGV